MEVYLVGGAVRDQLLGLPVTERDYVVVHATPQEMLQLGYKAVGKDFPVFLHPKTHEEYALARTEKKVAPGYTGFQCYCDPTVSLYDDLKRRDLTINAIARDANGQLIDPYGGQQDLKRRIFRHVSEAFVEDPVRLLRLARFAARFADFTIAPETHLLLKRMVAQHEVDALVPERVWQEFRKALAEPHAARFLEVLNECKALAVLFPMLEKPLTAISVTWQRLVTIKHDALTRFTALALHLTASELQNLTQKYRIAQQYTKTAKCAIFLRDAICDKLTADQVITILEKTHAYQQPELLKTAGIAFAAFAPQYIAQVDRLQYALAATRAIKLTPEQINTTHPLELRQVLHQMRCDALGLS